MQPDLGLALALPPPQRPMHARQGVKEAAVLNEPPPFGLTASGQILGQATEHLFQNSRIDQMLGFGKTAQAHRPGANFLLHTGQLAGRAQAAHGSHYGIKKTE
jgi:hypothetical protein